MTRYDLMKFYGYNSLEEMDAARKREEEGAARRLAAMKAQKLAKVDDYRDLLKECELKLSYLVDCEIENTWEGQKVKELIAKIQTCLKED